MPLKQPSDVNKPLHKGFGGDFIYIPYPSFYRCFMDGG